MTEKTLTSRGGDFLLHMESPQRNLHYGKLTMPASGGPHTKENVVGLPLKANNVVALATEEANVVAFVLWGDPISAVADDGETSDNALYTIVDIFDGCVLNQDALPASDTQATPVAYTAATIVANAADSVNSHKPKWVSEPVQTEIQLD